MATCCLPVDANPGFYALTILMKRCLSFTLCVALLASTACRRTDDHDHSKAGHSHEHEHKHAHVAPHGGTAVVLGDEAFHLEFVQDTQLGTLTAYVLDGHMEQFIRIGMPAFAAVLSVEGRTESLVFNAVANLATDETVGDTSQFVAQADWLKQTNRFEAKITGITIRGQTFENVSFRFPEGNEHKH